ncbi:hypothetical protein NKJ48_32875, partial [Mesorhizobium sp. M0114]|uniref:hypothetical protein n=1 Tax=unclassified Mesorhizobium TaxID=325217 RepID=UPI0033363E55
AVFGRRALWRARNLFLYFYQCKTMSYGGEGGFELRAWKSVLLVLTVQAGYSGRQSALPRFVSDISAGN